MKITKKNTIKSQFLPIVGGLVVLAAAGVLLYVLVFGGNFLGWTTKTQTPDTSNQPFNTQPPTDEQIKNGANTKDNTQTNSDKNKPGKLIVSLSAINQTSSLLQIRAITSTVSGAGSCSLTLTNGDKVVTKTADLQALPSSSTCKGFDVAKSELSKGIWKITVDITIGTQSGTITDSVEIK